MFKTEFEQFQDTFKKYQEKFGNLDYQVYFKHGNDEGFASIHADGDGRIATVTLGNNVTSDEKPYKDIKTFAKHEAIHLLINDLVNLAQSRYLTEIDITRESERLTFKLQNLIPDIEES